MIAIERLMVESTGRLAIVAEGGTGLGVSVAEWPAAATSAVSNAGARVGIVNTASIRRASPRPAR